MSIKTAQPISELTHIEEAIKWSLNLSTLNTPKLELNNFKIFPNPVNDIVEVQTSHGINKLSLFVYNTLGEVLFSKDMSTVASAGESLMVDMTNFAQGVYLFSFSSDTSSKTYKVVKL